VLRRILNPMGTQDAIEFLLDKLKQTKGNASLRLDEHVDIVGWATAFADCPRVVGTLRLCLPTVAPRRQ